MATKRAGQDLFRYHVGAYKLLFVGTLIGVCVGLSIGTLPFNAWTSNPQWLRLYITGISSHAYDVVAGFGNDVAGDVSKSRGRKAAETVGVDITAESEAEPCTPYFRSRPGTEFHLQSGPQIRFVIFTTAHSGSHSLVSVFNNHPAIQSNLEAFHLRGVWAEGWNHTHTSLRDEDRNDFVNLLFHPANPAYKKNKKSAIAFGFPILPQHLSLEELRSLVKAKNVKKIILRRRHLLPQFVKQLREKQKAKYAKFHASGKKVYVNVASFKNFSSWHAGYYDACISSYFGRASQEERGNWHFVDYEALAQDPVRNVNSIFEFLGVRQIGQKVAAPGALKLDVPPLSESIANLAEVTDALDE